MMDICRRALIEILNDFPITDGQKILKACIQRQSTSVEEMYEALHDLWKTTYPNGEDKICWGPMNFERFLAILMLTWPTPEVEVKGRLTYEWNRW